MTKRLASPSDVHSQIFGFLAGEFARKEEWQCTRIELLRGRGTAFNDEIRSWNRTEHPQRFEIRRADASGKDVENPTVREFALEIMNIAEAETAGSSGRHRFTLRSSQVYGGRQTCGFSIVTSNEEGSSDPELDPSAAGQSLLMMRGFDAMLKVNKDMHASTLGIVGGIAQQQMEELIELRKENTDQRKKIQDLENDQTEREWKIYQEQLADNRAKQNWDRMFQLGSVAVASFSQGKLGAAAAAAAGADGSSPITMMLREFFQSITPDQQKSLMTTLRMEQLMMLNTISQLVAPAEPPPPPNGGPNASAPPGTSPNGAH